MDINTIALMDSDTFKNTTKLISNPDIINKLSNIINDILSKNTNDIIKLCNDKLDMIKNYEKFNYMLKLLNKY